MSIRSAFSLSPVLAPVLALVLALLLAACSQSDEAQAPNDGKRVMLPTQTLAPDQPPQQPDGAEWREAGGGLALGELAFAVPGAAPLLTIVCVLGPDGQPRLRFVRHTRAEAGAKALFAIEGNGHVARIALDVTRAGDPGEWQGEVAASDKAAEAIKGGGAVNATLPGGGTLKLPASDLPGKLLDACRARHVPAGRGGRAHVPAGRTM